MGPPWVCGRPSAKDGLSRAGWRRRTGKGDEEGWGWDYPTPGRLHLCGSGSLTGERVRLNGLLGCDRQLCGSSGASLRGPDLRCTREESQDEAREAVVRGCQTLRRAGWKLSLLRNAEARPIAVELSRAPPQVSNEVASLLQADLDHQLHETAAMTCGARAPSSQPRPVARWHVVGHDNDHDECGR